MHRASRKEFKFRAKGPVKPPFAAGFRTVQAHFTFTDRYLLLVAVVSWFLSFVSSENLFNGVAAAARCVLPIVTATDALREERQWKAKETNLEMKREERTRRWAMKDEDQKVKGEERTRKWALEDEDRKVKGEERTRKWALEDEDRKVKGEERTHRWDLEREERTRTWALENEDREVERKESTRRWDFERDERTLKWALERKTERGRGRKGSGAGWPAVEHSLD
ncbi:hypothetical protein DFH27DRAFT_643732 [Peziza echinospora]|nr:hypothetical protein DFH27DRAFT_643732 [Peziza echinospora]